MQKAKLFIAKFIHTVDKHDQYVILLVSTLLSSFFILYYFHLHLTLAYGDAESHLNIAKRVIDSLTPGLAQLGGVWLPLPHLMMIPFILPNGLWQTGLGGAFVSGVCYVVSALFIYKIIFLLTKNKSASFVGYLLFALNPNVLYMQSTPMSELPMIIFNTLSLYFFFLFLDDDTNLVALLGAGFFGFLATLARYDGWFLVIFEALVLMLFYFPRGIKNHILEGKAILFSTVSFFGVALWLLWDKLIMGDAFYFTNSPFSAKSQQQGWLTKGELPAYKNLWESFLYYFTTTLGNIGIILFVLACIGMVFFLFDRKQKNRWFISLLLVIPFIFYVSSLYLGQAVIFIPSLTPASYPWHLFNVRYGMMMIPAAAIFLGYLYSKLPKHLEGILVIALLIQTSLFATGINTTLTIQDGTHGLSASSHPDAQKWISKHYTGGYVLLDDYARTISITGSHLPIQSVIYIGNKPYWQDALQKPQDYVEWVVLQKGDAVWTNIYENPQKRGNLYKYYAKAYTSPNILIFKRNDRKVAHEVLSEK